MSLLFLLWLAVFILQAVLLGRTMYMLISLSDLENDFINPYDLTTRMNRFWMLDYGVQLLITVMLLVSGNWVSGLAHLGMLLYLVKLLLSNQHLVNATDAFKDLAQQKKRRIVIFGFYIATFVLITYRLIESVIHTLLTPEGRQTAKKVMNEAVYTIW